MGFCLSIVFMLFWSSLGSLGLNSYASWNVIGLSKDLFLRFRYQYYPIMLDCSDIVYN